MINAFTIGTSAILAGQSALDVVGQNIANAATPGYHRQTVNLVNNTSGGLTGTGVGVASVTRYTNDPVRAAIVAGNSDQGFYDTRLAVRQQIQTALNSGTGGIGDQLNSFFNQVEQLTSTPDNTAARQPLVATAANLAQQINNAAGAIDKIRADLGAQVTSNINQVNTLSKQIADLNNRILSAEQVGTQPNDLLDQRDQLVNNLSQIIDIKTANQPFGVVNVIATGAGVVVGQTAASFQVAPDASGNLQVTESGSTQPVTFNSGTLGAQLQEYNSDIPATRSQLDAFAGQLISQVNQVQATGIGLNGPSTSATGTSSVSSPTALLNAAGLPFPVQAGQLTVSVTAPGGNRANSAIAIDPATQSLQDVAAALNGVTGLQASVTSGGQLQIQAQAGYSFDFAGRDTNPPGGGAVANPDTAGILSALGINGLFTGSNAASIAVNPAVSANPNLLAGSTTGDPGDTTNLQRIAALRDKPVLNGQTLAQNFAGQAASVGADVQNLGDQQSTQSGMMKNLAAQEQSVTGVDTNEELVQLLNFQRMVQGASQYMSAVNTALDSVLNIIK